MTLANFPPSPTDDPAYLVARWRVALPLAFPPELRQWYLARVAVGPHLTAAITHTNVSFDLFQRIQVTAPKFQLTVHLPIAAAPHGTTIPSPSQLTLLGLLVGSPDPS